MKTFTTQFRPVAQGRQTYGWLGRSRKGQCFELDADDVSELWPEYLEVMTAGRLGPRVPFPRLLLPIEQMNARLLRALRAVPQVVRGRTTLVLEWGDVTRELHAARRELLVDLGFGLGMHVRSGSEAPATIGSAVLLGAHMLLVDPRSVTEEQLEEVRGALGRWMQVISLQDENASVQAAQAQRASSVSAPNSAWGEFA
jgi:hypothetical protein